ncbi:MAG: epoxyqueuosine reductase [Thermoguttaceae bacterium]
MRSVENITRVLSEAALKLGFELVGATPCCQPESFERFENWIEQGHHAGMSYLARNLSIRSNPELLLPGVKSLLMLGVPFATVLQSDPTLQQLFQVKSGSGSKHESDFSQDDNGANVKKNRSDKDNQLDEDNRFDRDVRLNNQLDQINRTNKTLLKVASYACGADYHDWIRKRLHQLGDLHHQVAPKSPFRGVVDTAPLLERQFAVNAGLGVIGKNTMLIHPKWGSRLFLAAFLTTEELEYTIPGPELETFNPCLDCNLCISHCPNQALIRPFELNAGQCLNYWTIEHHGEMPETVQSVLADRFFGCETCLDVCPWNRQTAQTVESGFVVQEQIVSMTEGEFQTHFAGTPIANSKKRQHKVRKP